VWRRRRASNENLANCVEGKQDAEKFLNVYNMEQGGDYKPTSSRTELLRECEEEARADEILGDD
jgi:hypothetical protein